MISREEGFYMDDKSSCCFKMATLLIILALVVGVFQFYVGVKMKVNNIHFNIVQ